ncbi:MAG: hypothetical protein FWD16_00115 [Clostridia bacterium]|nr:hypothetical protein [Clostridia bacterium]
MNNLQDFLTDYARRAPRRFHMPGHHGRAFPWLARPQWDITEIPGADDLAAPSGPLLALSKKIAAVYGACEAFISVQGSTLGLQACILAFARENEPVLMGENCHRAVFGGLELARAHEICISPLPTYENLKEILKNTGAKTVILTRPTYAGLCGDCKGWARACHEAGAKLLVDEAHGAHLAFCGSLPKTALACGADAAVCSAHKSLPAPGQTAWVVAAHPDNAAKIGHYMRLLQTTSPSYILLAGLEGAVDFAIQEGIARLNKILPACKSFAPDINQDPTRIVIKTPHAQSLYGHLSEAGFEMEAVHGELLIGIATMADEPEDIIALQNAISAWRKSV